MVYLLQNVRSLVSFQKICVPNHTRFQLPVIVLNGWLAYTSTHPVILNTINSWIYRNMMWLNHIMGSVLCYLVLLVYWLAYLCFSEWNRPTWSINVINNSFICLWVSSIRQFMFHHVLINVSQISTFWSEIQAYHITRYTITCFYILIRIIFYIFYYVLGLYFVSYCMWLFYIYLEDGKVL